MNDKEERELVLNYLKEHNDKAVSIRTIAHDLEQHYTKVWASINSLYSSGLVGRVDVNRRDKRFFYVNGLQLKKLK